MVKIIQYALLTNYLSDLELEGLSSFLLFLFPALVRSDLLAIVEELALDDNDFFPSDFLIFVGLALGPLDLYQFNQHIMPSILKS